MIKDYLESDFPSVPEGISDDDISIDERQEEIKEEEDIGETDNGRVDETDRLLWPEIIDHLHRSGKQSENVTQNVVQKKDVARFVVEALL